MLRETVVDVMSCLRRQYFVWGEGDFIRILELLFEGIDFFKTVNKYFLFMKKQNINGQ